MTFFVPVIFLQLIATSILVCTSASITVPPQDATVLLNDTAVFNCTGEGDTLKWTHKGNYISEEIAREQRISIVHHNVSDGMVSSSLYITATLNNDGVTIACLVLDPVLDSAGAVLTVRRISPVRDLSLFIDDMLCVIWTIPSVIAPDISVSDIRYTVTLEGGNITSTVSDIDDTYYQFTNITVLNCTVYTANVTAFDASNKMYSSDTAMADGYIIGTGKSKINS